MDNIIGEIIVETFNDVGNFRWVFIFFIEVICYLV